MSPPGDNVSLGGSTLVGIVTDDAGSRAPPTNATSRPQTRPINVNPDSAAAKVPVVVSQALNAEFERALLESKPLTDALSALGEPLTIKLALQRLKVDSFTPTRFDNWPVTTRQDGTDSTGQQSIISTTKVLVQLHLAEADSIKGVLNGLNPSRLSKARVQTRRVFTHGRDAVERQYRWDPHPVADPLLPGAVTLSSGYQTLDGTVMNLYGHSLGGFLRLNEADPPRFTTSLKSRDDATRRLLQLSYEGGTAMIPFELTRVDHGERAAT